MATLSDDGSPVYLDDIVVRSPGLRGSVEVTPPAEPGQRGGGDTTQALADALARADAAELLTLTLTELESTDAGGGGDRGGAPGDDLEIDVPAVNRDLEQILLVLAEDGTASWHLAEELGDDEEPAPSRGSGTRRYRIRRPAEGRPPTAATGADRGIGGTIGSLVLKFIVFPVVDKVIGAITSTYVEHWEATHRPPMLRTFGPSEYTVPGVALTDQDWRRLATGRALLFVHGTFAQAHTGFCSFPPELMQHWNTVYGGRLFAIDHPTMSEDPAENVRRLAAALQEAPLENLSLEIDIVSHSRGGLVARAIVENGADLGIHRLSVRTAVLVGAPNAGTALADPKNIRAWLDRLTNLAQLIPDNPVTDILEVVLSVLKQVAIAGFGGLSGLTAMDPKGGYLGGVNTGDWFASAAGARADYRAIASNYEPKAGERIWRAVRANAKDAVIDLVFAEAENDLVVPTAGVAAVAGFPGFRTTDSLVLTGEDAVDHSSYFGHPPVVAKLREWLPG
ncbi:alpha/beta hydrolase [Microbacteriaceae bacterium VKM Ac-2855]|nr:alpha/beta hydrolase [Microbacteriaceae bacterium VKM Ac-2855]